MMTRRITFAALACSALCLPLSSQGRGRERAPPPELEHGTFTTGSFASKALQRDVPYGVYLPEEYSAEGAEDQQFPLIVWLHGMFEDHERLHVRGGVAIIEQMMAEGQLPKAVVVTAEGGRVSFYVNGTTSGAWEDMVTQDLLPHVDATHRVAKGREQRAIMGVSMGGYGALKIALRHPELFGAVAVHSVAVLPRNPDELDERFPWLERWGGGQKALGAVFGDPLDRDLWRAENILEIVAGLEPAALRGLRIYFDCGDEDRYGFHKPNQQLHELLTTREIAHDWRLVEGGDHGWRSGYNQDALPHSLGFVAAAWATAAGTAGLGGVSAPGGAAPGESGG
ncbi:MAG: alpha/beta hydrolase-fold protein [Planctomycetota bacterium]